MAFKIGFISESDHKSGEVCAGPPKQAAPRRSVVQVYFPARHRTLAYYNDRFDLRQGDLVFVDGKLEGKQGRVEEASYNFRIRLSDYQRVIAVADTAVHGRFYAAGSHFITFDRNALPAQKAVTWFLPPRKPEDEFACGADDTAFPLGELKEMKVTYAVAERGHDYYCRNLVRCICRRNIRGSRKGYDRKSRACHACKRRALSRAYDGLQKSARQSKDRRHRQKYRCCCRRSG